MTVALITGSGGLVGSEAAVYFAGLGFDVVGIDNDMRGELFGEEGSTHSTVERLRRTIPGYRHYDIDIRDQGAVFGVFQTYGRRIGLIVHTAAQPSHDWASRAPLVDFSINANGTLNLLEATRQHAPDAVFIFTSTNKVYGDRPNALPLHELATRWEIDPDHPYAAGIPEEMSIDRSLHSLMGASKAAADIMVQEYGRYFDMKTVCIRGGCLTGPNHSGTQLHGFLSYLVKCTITGKPYTVLGYKGKQVRDNIHSFDLIRAFHELYKNPPRGEAYNLGGSRFSNCSMLEAIEMSEQITGRELNWSYREENRIGDHIWWISDVGRFQRHYPTWTLTYDVRAILTEIAESGRERWTTREAVGATSA
jgi:CDP-paratose 2-epimerase